MSGLYTSFLNLFKTNMTTDGNDTFDFDRDLNENWDKIDTLAGNVIQKDGSVTFTAEQKGVDPISPTGLTTLQKVQALISNFANKTLSNLTLSTALNNLGFLGQSLSANGYYKLPNGLIIQWGNFTLSGGYYVDKTVIFPISFTSQIFSINGGNYSASNTTFFCLKGKDLNQFVARIEDKGGQGLGSVTCFWLAVGI